MDDEVLDARDAIIAATLPHVAFEGLTDRALSHGVEDAGFGEDMLYRAFPDDMQDFVRFWFEYGDRRMQAAMEARDDLAHASDKERLAAAMFTRVNVDAAEKHSVRRISSFLALPMNAATGAKLTIGTINAILHAAGDTSTDFSYYTKRGLLMPTYSMAVLYWLNDDSEGNDDTRAFIERLLAGPSLPHLPRPRLPQIGADGAGLFPEGFRPPNPVEVLRGPLSGLRDRLADRFG